MDSINNRKANGVLPHYILGLWIVLYVLCTKERSETTVTMHCTSKPWLSNRLLRAGKELPVYMLCGRNCTCNYAMMEQALGKMSQNIIKIFTDFQALFSDF